MSKHEAVDRLMALAMEKRADRVPEGVPLVDEGRAGRRPDEGVVGPGPVEARGELSGPGPELVEEHGGKADIEGPRRSAGDRGRQILAALRPLLPAVAGAMRLVDHGGVQAVARFLPLLGVTGGTAPRSAPQEQEQRLQREEMDKAVRREIEAMGLRVAASEEVVGRMRTVLERLTGEQTEMEHQVRALGDRVRLLSAGVVILLMVSIAQMVLLVVQMHR